MKFPANRVVLALHSLIVILTIVGFYIAAVTKSLPEKWQATAAAVAGVIAALIAGTTMAVKFLDGSQKYDVLINEGALQVRQLQARERVSTSRQEGDNVASKDTSPSGQVSDDPRYSPPQGTLGQLPATPRPVDLEALSRPVLVDGDLEAGPNDDDLLADAGAEALDSERWLANRAAVAEDES